MTVLIVSVAIVLLVSGLCSLSEAAIYAVRMPYVRNLTEAGTMSGRLLMGFKENMEQPISAILVINTVANTAGAAVAGAQAHTLYGEASMLWFSACFTLAVLVIAEIIPKIVGVAYSERVSRLVALPLHVMTRVLLPLVWVIQQMSQYLKPSKPLQAAPEEEVEQLARMSAEEGSILAEEADLVQNVLHLNDVTAREIMTPRPVVLKFPAGMTVQQVSERTAEWTYSRIPVFADDDPEIWVGFVLRRDILACLAKDEFDVALESICRPLLFVDEGTAGHVLLKSFVRRKTHIFGVTDWFGDLIGIVTLEDVVESLIGEEIVDEVDSAVDMQEVARLRQHDRLRGQKEIDRPADEP